MGDLIRPDWDRLRAKEATGKAQKAAKEREPGWLLFKLAMETAKKRGFSQEQAQGLVMYLSHIRSFDITKEELDDDLKFIQAIIVWHRQYDVKPHACECGGECADCETNILIGKIKAAAVNESFSRQQAVVLIQWLRVLYKVDI